ncbi:Larval cuticle protein LCP-17 [Orchesella cincta]|uniref:Larval cuticle protein LCP-17 n=1 Tax=Orchesella cincta TaxID=48709 RepID=A0A1D2MBK2_ORCCI|nr:Larval cuticle protein LCP-17 [Orchesella cincta]
MNYAIVITLLYGVVVCAQEFRSIRNANEIVITRSESENNGDGTFKWASEFSDGTKLEQRSYSYISPEGEKINLKYIADENGFQPEGNHLPTPPPIPEEIQKALRIIEAASSNQIPQFIKPVSQPRRF